MDEYVFEPDRLNSSHNSTETVISIPIDADVEDIPLDQNDIHDFDNEIEINSQDSEGGESDLDNYELTFEEQFAEDNDQDPLHPIFPLANTQRDKQYPEDHGHWMKPDDADDVWSVPPIPLLVTGGVLNMVSDGREPEHFFEALFDDHMWTHLAENTNLYAAKRRTLLGNCPIEAIDNPAYKQYSRLNNWKEVTEAELQVFVAHLLVMGVLRKSELETYWCTTGVCRIPFFGKWMSRNRFTAILANLHVTDDSNNPKFGSAGHDALAKLRPFLTMCEDNFKFTYRPHRDLSMDESCCPWKGRLRFKVYNPRKPARFHIKIFQMCEATSGYILGFSVYTGKNSCTDDTICVDPQCTTTTKVVMSLANQCQLLDKGHRIYFDNYYSSPELLEELLHRNTSSCGTVRSNRKRLPAGVTKANLKPGESCFRRSVANDGEPGSILALKWCDKRAVYMISTCHAATEQWTGKNNRTDGTPIYKPSVIVDYISKMGGVDLSDQLLTYYSFLRKSCKWWRKLFVHLLNMLILNAYILNKKFGNQKINHIEYREYIAGYLIKKAKGNSADIDEDNTMELNIEEDVNRLIGMHLPQKLYTPATGRIKPLTCKVCYIGKKESQDKGKPRRRKSTSYKCLQCNKAMCIEPCFRLYHLHHDYKSFL